MKYMLMFAMDEEEQLPEAEYRQRLAAIDGWFADLGPQLVSGERLQSTRSATTVNWRGGEPLVTDGPFIESKEVIGGFAIIDVADLDAAIAIAKRWPGGHPVEIRPVVPMGERLE